MTKAMVGVDIPGSSYTFNAAARTITITGVTPLSLEMFVTVTNVTTGCTIYQFNSRNLKGSLSGNVLLLSASSNLTGSADNDRLQIWVDRRSYGPSSTNDSISVAMAPDQPAVTVAVLPDRNVFGISRIGTADDSASIAVTGSGESFYDATTTKSALSVGSAARQPGRIYVEGRQLRNNGHDQYLNGVNTPWHSWNEFGMVSGGSDTHYNHAWWDAEFQRLVDRGINATRVWLIDDSTNEGVVLDAGGNCAVPTATFWSNVDDIMALAELYQIYIMPTLFSFDHFSWNTANSERWHRMLGDESKVTTLVTNYIVPLVERYKTNIYFWAVDLCNEMDWLSEKGDYATPRNGTCTPVGGGSRVVDFGQRVPDFVVGQHLYADDVDMGVVITRTSDTQCVLTNPFPGSPSTFTNGSGSGHWIFTGWNWRHIQRYLAMASAAIHKSDSTALVTVGVGTIKYASAYYDGDHYSDALLSAETNDTSSRLDFHQIHWYQWAEPWYRLFLSPTDHGLSVKPAIMGEFPAHWAGLNIPKVFPWKAQSWYNQNSFVWLDDNGTKRKYKCITAGNTGVGIGPSGTGSDITDGDAHWKYMENTWETVTAYNVYDMVIGDSGSTGGIGRIYICTQAGTSADNSGGPNWTHDTQDDGTVKWHYVREACADESDVYNAFIAGGWCGHMPWTSNTVDMNLGIYSVDLSNQYMSAWGALTDYYVNNVVSNDSNKRYRCTVQGKSAASGGPTGTGSTITDGGVTWAYVETMSNFPWTSTGLALRAFADDNDTTIFPDITGDWNNSGSVIRQSRERAWHVHGNTMRFIQSFEAGTAEAGINQRVGPFDDNDGIFLAFVGATPDISIGFRSNGIDTVHPQAIWNIDKLDGTGLSGVELNTASRQVLVVDMAWMTGALSVGFLIDSKIIWAHSIPATNSEEFALPSNPNLPLRWEISTTESVSTRRTFQSLHGHVLSTGKDKNPTPSGYSRGNSAEQLGGGDKTEMIAIRVIPASNRFMTLRPKRLDVICTSGVEQYYINWRIVRNPTTSSDGTWVVNPGSNTAQYNITRGVNADTGEILAQGIVRGNASVELTNMPLLGADALGVGDIISLQIFNLPNSSNYFFATLEWDDYR